MNEFLKVLLNIRSLRAALRELSFEQLEEVNEKFSSIYNERAAEIEKTRAADAERLAKLAEFQAMLADAGIDPAELVQGVTAGKAQREGAKRAPRPPKYRYMDNGEEHTWTGQGRTPKALAAMLEQGRQLEEFLI
ncbi:MULTISPECIES: H-NS family nucleoid-associated regulatory protein [Aeromonas]|uniref:H-NS family histone-like protein n=1 Tax=Aeromonas TaxID=642 RepID=UPI001432FAAD|nr:MULTISPECIES: H-NS family nucleoid-associated regulatory protein [Aeromonas]NKD15019.1 H-NS histone family protein [Aeromonas caviae]